MSGDSQSVNPAGATGMNDNIDQLSVTSVVSGNDFQNMIEDCLLEIFYCKSLTLIDLCSIAETCKRIQGIVQRIALKEIRFDNGVGNEVCKVYWRNLTSIEEYTQSGVEKIFRNFGSTMSVLLFRDFDLPYLYNLILNYCGDNLETLKIHRSFLPNIPTGTFTQLKQLHLQDVNIKPNASTFVQLISLVELKVMRVRNSRVILKNHFPKLERFTFVGTIQHRVDELSAETVESFEVLKTFFELNHTLKTIKFQLDDFNEMYMISLLKKMAYSCKELDVFRVNRVYAFFLEPLQSSKSLVCLELWDMSCQDLHVFAPLTTLRTLSLNRCRLPKLASEFTALAQLTKLDVNATQSYSSIDVVGIISELVNLEVFTINRRRTLLSMVPFVLDKKVFAKIVDIVKERTNVLTMTCETNFIPTYFKNNDKIRLLPLRNALQA